MARIKQQERAATLAYRQDRAMLVTLRQLTPDNRSALMALLGVAESDLTSERRFATKAERAAGNGIACSVVPPCGRNDLRTADRAALHAADGAELKKFGHEAR